MSSESGSARTGIVWFKPTDLRIHDHEPLAAAHATCSEVGHIFCFDPRWFGRSSFGFPKTGAHRAKFMIEAVADLKRSMEERGQRLLIAIGKPEKVLAEVAAKCSAQAVFTHQETCSEELEVERALDKELARRASGCAVWRLWGNTLHHVDDLPFAPSAMPDVFTRYRVRVEKECRVRPEAAPPGGGGLCPFPAALRELAEASMARLPSLSDFGLEEVAADERGVLRFVGGERAALARLHHYFWEADCVREYKETRNGMVGADYSSKFAPWMALGCLSPRRVYWELKKYEQHRVANQSTYWLVFEILWRDFFRFSSIKWGTTMFKLTGPRQQPITEHWTRDESLVRAWCEGRTGYPFVDANMRELRLTGFMSNRGRQNVASFLVKDLGIDWRVGAEWFESTLIDYDPCSNWGNWTYVAGVGADPREGRYFSITKQAKQYDPHAHFIRRWVPEVAGVPLHYALDVGQLPPAKRAELCPEYPVPVRPLRHPDAGRGSRGHGSGGHGGGGKHRGGGHADGSRSARGGRGRRPQGPRKGGRLQHDFM